MAHQRMMAGPGDSRGADAPMGQVGGFALIWCDRYMMLLALFTVRLNVVNASGLRGRRHRARRAAQSDRHCHRKATCKGYRATTSTRSPAASAYESVKNRRPSR